MLPSGFVRGRGGRRIIRKWNSTRIVRVCVCPEVLFSVKLFLVLRRIRLFVGLLGTSLFRFAKDQAIRRACKIAKKTISFVMSVRPSVRPSARMEQLGSHWTDFIEV